LAVVETWRKKLRGRVDARRVVNGGVFSVAPAEEARGKRPHWVNAEAAAAAETQSGVKRDVKARQETRKRTRRNHAELEKAEES
jgi:hypothetical protein